MQLYVHTLLPAYYCSKGTKAVADRRLETLSHHLYKLTNQMPDVETVRGFLLPEGAKMGAQYRYGLRFPYMYRCSRVMTFRDRSAMHVLDVVLAHEDNVVRDSCNALTAWYWHVKRVPFRAEDYETLEDLTKRLWETLKPFQLLGCSIATPKMHCCAKLKGTVSEFGTCEHVTTDCYERAHKAHKAVFLRCVFLRCSCTRLVIFL